MVLSLFTFSCISHWQAGLGIIQCCNIVPSIGFLYSGLYFALQLPRGFDHFYGAGRGGEPPPPRGAGRPSMEAGYSNVLSNTALLGCLKLTLRAKIPNGCFGLWCVKLAISKNIKMLIQRFFVPYRSKHNRGLCSEDLMQWSNSSSLPGPESTMEAPASQDAGELLWQTYKLKRVNLSLIPN